MNRGSVVGVSAVADWVYSVIDEVRGASDDTLFTLVDLHTESVLRTETTEKIGQELAAFDIHSKRFGDLQAKGQFPKQKQHDTETSLAALALTDVMHEFLLPGRTDSGQYAVRSGSESWKRGTYLGLFLNERPGPEHRTIAALGLVAPIGKSGTFERKVEVSHFTALSLPIPVEHFSHLGKLVRDAFDRNRGIPSATGKKILNKLAATSDEAAERIRSLETRLALEEPDIKDRPVRALEKDAVGVLFEAFDIDREHLLSWRPTGDGDPFLSGVNGALKGGRYNPQEKWLVDFDATHLPGWSFHRSDYVAWGVFTNKYKSRSLLVANIDRTPVEHATGVDLVYYNPHGGNFVMLQYKVLEETVRGGLHSSVDPRFLEQIDRMRETDERFRDPNPRHHDIRLVDTPCFIKLCAPQTRMSAGVEIASGMYFSREHFEILHENAEEEGYAKGKRIRRREIPRYLNGSDFISLFSNGWLGSRGTGTEQLYQELEVSLSSGRSVVLGVHTDGLPLMNHSSGRWPE
ncbi:hypothetical protein ACWGSK_26215 [Nocardiopsis sp. NPDC055551]|uniref:hypothetical protein n=1 Tax=Nocardiopsis sp. NPDC006832 TaxID=3157188 RepID=UPI0033F98788